MDITTSIPVQRTNRSKIHTVDFNNLVFGSHTSDHMLICDYAEGTWQQPEIIPYGELPMSPATQALHYGQTVFEGMKAFRMDDGAINIFRIYRHYERFNRSLERMCMPAIPEDIFVEGIRQLVELDRAWVPEGEGSALYIRPFMYASEARFGIKVAEEFRFIIFTGPVGPIYNKPLRVRVETEYVRAPKKGGTGFAKCGGNYAGALYATRQAREAGYDQVLWTDAQENRFIEESGSMNVLFVINNTLVTPPPSHSILDGINRASLLVLAEEMGIPVEERAVSIDELKDTALSGNLTEAFGAGTAAIVAPIHTIGIDGIDFTLPGVTEKSIQQQLKNKLAAIRSGREADIYGWNDILG